MSWTNALSPSNPEGPLLGRGGSRGALSLRRDRLRPLPGGAVWEDFLEEDEGLRGLSEAGCLSGPSLFPL